MARSPGFLRSVARALLTSPRPIPAEAALLADGGTSPETEQAVRAVETRLFFEPALLRECRALPPRTTGWPRRALAATVLAFLLGAMPMAVAQAEETVEAGGDSTEIGAGDETTVWDWFVEVIVASTNSGGNGSENGEEDPGGGD